MIKYIRSLSRYGDIGKIAAYEKKRAGQPARFCMFVLLMGRAFFVPDADHKCEFAKGVNYCVEEYDSLRQR